MEENGEAKILWHRVREREGRETERQRDQIIRETMRQKDWTRLGYKR